MSCNNDNIGKILSVQKIQGVINVQEKSIGNIITTRKQVGKIVDYCIIISFAYDLNFDL